MRPGCFSICQIEALFKNIQFDCMFGLNMMPLHPITLPDAENNF